MPTKTIEDVKHCEDGDLENDNSVEDFLNNNYFETDFNYHGHIHIIGICHQLFNITVKQTSDFLHSWK